MFFPSKTISRLFTWRTMNSSCCKFVHFRAKCILAMTKVLSQWFLLYLTGIIISNTESAAQVLAVQLWQGLFFSFHSDGGFFAVWLASVFLLLLTDFSSGMNVRKVWEKSDDWCVVDSRVLCELEQNLFKVFACGHLTKLLRELKFSDWGMTFTISFPGTLHFVQRLQNGVIAQELSIWGILWVQCTFVLSHASAAFSSSPPNLPQVQAVKRRRFFFCFICFFWFFSLRDFFRLFFRYKCFFCFFFQNSISHILFGYIRKENFFFHSQRRGRLHFCIYLLFLISAGR